jgi:hypothetical protein
MNSLPLFRLLFIALFFVPLFCSETVQQGAWKNSTFMDCDNVTHKIAIRLSDARYDSETGFLRVEGAVRNRMKEYRLFNVRNWVYRLNDKGEYLKPQSVGLPSLPLQAMKADGTSREESFVLIYHIGSNASIRNIILDYADQFFMTGQVNKIILSIPLEVQRGTVSSRG